jgi:hypothetical protein
MTNLERLPVLAEAGAGNLSMRAKISAVAPSSGRGRPAACAIAAGDGKFPETPEYSAAGHGAIRRRFGGPPNEHTASSLASALPSVRSSGRLDEHHRTVPAHSCPRGCEPAATWRLYGNVVL